MELCCTALKVPEPSTGVVPDAVVSESQALTEPGSPLNLNNRFDEAAASPERPKQVEQLQVAILPPPAAQQSNPGASAPTPANEQPSSHLNLATANLSKAAGEQASPSAIAQPEASIPKPAAEPSTPSPLGQPERPMASTPSPVVRAKASIPEPAGEPSTPSPLSQPKATVYKPSVPIVAVPKPVLARPVPSTNPKTPQQKTQKPTMDPRKIATPQTAAPSATAVKTPAAPMAAVSKCQIPKSAPSQPSPEAKALQDALVRIKFLEGQLASQTTERHSPNLPSKNSSSSTPPPSALRSASTVSLDAASAAEAEEEENVSSDDMVTMPDGIKVASPRFRV